MLFRKLVKFDDGETFQSSQNSQVWRLHVLLVKSDHMIRYFVE